MVTVSSLSSLQDYINRLLVKWKLVVAINVIPCKSNSISKNNSAYLRDNDKIKIQKVIHVSTAL